MTVLGLVAVGCATARTDFQPYSATSERAPVLDRAVEARKQDLPVLAAAGAVIVGTVRMHGDGFAGLGDITDAAAQEAARHGGTHVVLGMTVEKTARGGQRLLAVADAAVQGNTPSTAYRPGRTLNLTALVLRLPEDASWVRLPAPLRPTPGVHVMDGDAPSTAGAQVAQGDTPAPPPDDAAARALAPLPPGNATSAGEALMIDGSHIQPLPAAGD